ncbi:hypothetical protein E3P99_01506 [Wallemia hederae]|uniref:CBS domain-containing protein n=1 Tax=Wallemia hederae TaxID=1540922 RepID=A0A4T0FQ35_9BASI|nr:hypothetical protein E3P99_01506 [Wallemia hederae]
MINAAKFISSTLRPSYLLTIVTVVRQDGAAAEHSRLVSISLSPPISYRKHGTDWVQDSLKPVDVPRLLLPLSSWLVFLLVGLSIGLVSGVVSMATVWISNAKTGFCASSVWTISKITCHQWRRWSDWKLVNYIIYVVLSTLFAFIAAITVKKLSRRSAGSGIGEMKSIIAGFENPEYLRLPVLLVKTCTLPFAIASGLSIGKEGPSVHVACCIGELVASLFPYFHKSKLKVREILIAASAAGVACAFGSPIGGVMFSIEEMTHTYTTKMIWRSFFCALAATAMLSALNPFQTDGKLVLFQVTYDRNWHFFEIIYFIVLGVFGGLFGTLVIKLNMLYSKFRQNHLRNNGVMEVVLLAFLTAIICYPNPFLRIDQTESMSVLFRECDGIGGARSEENFGICDSGEDWTTINRTLLATLLRTLLLIITYGAQVPAGIFVPSLAAGATFGRLVGTLSRMVYSRYSHIPLFGECRSDAQCITPGTYALLGAAASLSGVMRIWVTIPIIIFELTGALNYILPTMIVVITTKAVCDFISGGEAGIADQMVRMNGMPVLTRDDDNYFNVRISGVMKRRVVVLEESVKVADLDRVLEEEEYSGYPVVQSTQSMKLVGYVDADVLQQRLASLAALSQHSVVRFSNRRTIFDAQNEEQDGSTGNQEIDLSDIVNDMPISMSPSTTVDVVMKMFKKIGPRVVLITRLGVLQGLVTVKDLLEETEMLRVGNERAIKATKASIGEDVADFWNRLKQGVQGVSKVMRWRGR